MLEVKYHGTKSGKRVWLLEVSEGWIQIATSLDRNGAALVGEGKCAALLDRLTYRACPSPRSQRHKRPMVRAGRTS